MTDFASPALEEALLKQDFAAIRTLFAFLHASRERAEGQRDALFLFYEAKLRQLEPGASAEPRREAVIAGSRVLASPSVHAIGATSRVRAKSSSENVEELGL